MSKSIVTDIEGTITDIRFVKEVLFPYAFEHIGAFFKKSSLCCRRSRWESFGF